MYCCPLNNENEASNTRGGCQREGETMQLKWKKASLKYNYINFLFYSQSKT